MSQELDNYDMWERKDGASIKVFIVVTHQTLLCSYFVLCFCFWLLSADPLL